jgi:hypothetical protein
MIYEYQCPKCQYIRCELRSLSEDSSFATHPCIMCDEPMPKTMSAPKGYVKDTTNPVKYRIK